MRAITARNYHEEESLHDQAGRGLVRSVTSTSLATTAPAVTLGPGPAAGAGAHGAKRARTAGSWPATRCVPGWVASWARVSYFNGGDAVHYFARGSYGSPQSLGCVELPYTAAKQAYPYLPYGTLVTVTA